MTWAAFRKWLYFPLLAILCCVAILFAVRASSDQRLPWLLAVAFVLIVPGFVGRWLLRDLFASRAMIARGRFAAGLAAARQFLANLTTQPWIRHAIWTQYGTYTLSVEAMALNNAGAALLELKRFGEARDVLLSARAADPVYPIPVFNLAVIAMLEDNKIESEELAKEAASLGFADGQLDIAHRAVGDAYARLATPL